MAVVVEVTQVYPQEQQWTKGTKMSGSVTVSITGDYDCPAPFQAQVGVQFTDQESRAKAVAYALDIISKIADQFKDGAHRATQDTPPGA